MLLLLPQAVAEARRAEINLTLARQTAEWIEAPTADDVRAGREPGARAGTSKEWKMSVKCVVSALAGVAFVPLAQADVRYDTRCLWRSGRDQMALKDFVQAVQGGVQSLVS